LTLTTTTFFVHQIDSEVWFWLDQYAIFIVVLCGSIYFVYGTLWYQIAALVCITAVVLLDKTGKDDWDSEGNKWIHILSSVGHHAILLGLQT
jgi:hypothetical protein